MKQISEETITALKQLIRNRNSYLDIKEVLDNLEDVDSQETKPPIKSVKIGWVQGTKTPDILKDLKDLRNHHGKSTIIDADLDTIINKYG